MGTTIWTIIGITATLVTFAIVYWKTTSARRERERHAHKDIVTVIARLLTQGQGSLDLPVVESLLKSKAREYDINLSTIDELPKIVEDLVAKFTESEFITSEVRHNLTEKALALQQKVERGKPIVQEAVAELEQSSRLTSRYKYSIFSSIAAALGVGATILVIAVELFVYDITQNLQYYVVGVVTITSLAALLTYFWASQERKKKEAKSSLYLGKVFDKMVLEVLHKIAPEASVERNVKIGTEDYFAEVDFVMRVNDENLPIEIKHSLVRPDTIATMVAVMSKLTTKRGILITSSQVGERIKKLAKSNNIILLEAITSEEDLIRGLTDAKLVA